MVTIVLASTSAYRRELLERLRIPFETRAPAFDEAPLPGEHPEERVVRCAEGKALSVARALPPDERDVLVIGSDQIPLLDDEALGKPLTHPRAVTQLRQSSGRRVRFLTSVTVVRGADGAPKTVVEPFEVQFRELSLREIEHYLKVDRPYDCAGSIRAEGLGVALFRSMAGRDPTALIGLPLIPLCELLRNEGVDPIFASTPPTTPTL